MRFRLPVVQRVRVYDVDFPGFRGDFMKTYLVVWVGSILCMTLFACEAKVTTTDACGDGYLDPGEECDKGALTVQSCEQLGYYVQDGTLKCNKDCTLDLSVCSAKCGDGIIQSIHGESCEGENFNGKTCQSMGLGVGTLICNEHCQIDTSGCQQTAVCGDGTIAAPFEQCEGTNLGGETCQGLGYYGGTLLCNAADCRFNLSGCASYGKCGDAQLQEMYGEECEGSNLGGAMCQSLGYYGGTLQCGLDCRYRLESCEGAGWCGDALVQEAHEEVCDGELLGGKSCLDLGYYGGELACAPDCRSLDMSDCAAMGRCGDGVLHVEFGELVWSRKSRHLAYGV